MIDTLSALDSIQIPGSIRDLPYRWSDDESWKDLVMRANGPSGHADDRTGRTADPQYQFEADRLAANAVLATGGCDTCFFPETA